jgi:hypothetical protein
VHYVRSLSYAPSFAILLIDAAPPQGEKQCTVAMVTKRGIETEELRLAKLAQDGVDGVESGINFFTDLY